MRIVVAGGGTGGHLYPGLAIARALVRLNPDVEPFFVGARRGIERDVLPTTAFEHELLDLHPLYRRQVWRNINTASGAWKSWGRLRLLMRQLQPRVMLGTGGYAAGLALAAAARERIPIVLQEQNSVPGLTMRFFSKRAREIYLGYPEAAHRLHRGRHTVVLDTGNPIDPPPPPAERTTRQTSLSEWGLPADLKHVLLVVGGSQGALPINEALAGALHSLVDKGVAVIWATGKAHYARYEQLGTNWVRVVPYLSPITRAYAAADLAVCRAGAITTAELCAWGIPSVLIPLPTAAADHQTANAVALESAGCAMVLRQSQLTPASLVNAVVGLLGGSDRLARMAAAAQARGRPQAAHIIATQVLALCDIR